MDASTIHVFGVCMCASSGSSIPLICATMARAKRSTHAYMCVLLSWWNFVVPNFRMCNELQLHCGLLSHAPFSTYRIWLISSIQTNHNLPIFNSSHSISNRLEFDFHLNWSMAMHPLWMWIVSVCLFTDTIFAKENWCFSYLSVLLNFPYPAKYLAQTTCTHYD